MNWNGTECGKRKLIAEGYSAKVYVTSVIRNSGSKPEKVVVKKFNREREEHFRVECEMFEGINPHPQFPEIFGIDKKELEIFMEYCKGGTLLELVNKAGRLDEQSAYLFFKQILQAVRHLRRQSICHRDLKLENILILRKDRNYLKIVDLSFSHRVTSPNTRCFKDKVGTEGYQCPEMLRNELYCGFEADIFSLGVILFELIHGKPPFFAACPESCEFYALFLRDKEAYWNLFSSLAPNISPELISLLQDLLTDNPDQRISLGKIFKHPWILAMSRTANVSVKMDETYMQSLQQQSVAYNKSNFITFLSRIFKNSSLHNNKKRLLNMQHLTIESNEMAQITQPLLNQQKYLENNQIQTDSQGFLQSSSSSKQHKENNQGIYSAVSDILNNQKVLQYKPQENSLSPKNNQQEKIDIPDRIQLPHSNIFQLIRQYSQHSSKETYMRLSYIKICHLPVDFKAIKQKYSLKSILPPMPYIHRILTTNNIADIAGFFL